MLANKTAPSVSQPVMPRIAPLLPPDEAEGKSVAMPTRHGLDTIASIRLLLRLVTQGLTFHGEFQMPAVVKPSARTTRAPVEGSFAPARSRRAAGACGA